MSETLYLRSSGEGRQSLVVSTGSVYNISPRMSYTQYNKTNSCILTLIKKKTKFPSYIGKFRWDRVQSYMRKGFLIYEEMRKFFPIYEEAFNHI